MKRSEESRLRERKEAACVALIIALWGLAFVGSVLVFAVFGPVAIGLMWVAILVIGAAVAGWIAWRADSELEDFE